MAVRKQPSGRWRAVVKIGRQYVDGRTFDTKREAETWHRQRKEQLSGHVDPRAGKISTEQRIAEWLEHRRATAQATTTKTDAYLSKWVPRAILVLPLDRVTPGMLTDSMIGLVEEGRAAKSIQRYRAMLGSFFSWAVERRIITTSPAKGVKVPAGGRPVEEMHPWTRAGLDARFAVWHTLHEDMAEVARFLGLTGLRWSEARALTVGDVSLVQFAAVTVQRARPEGVETKGTKSGKARRVPLADVLLPYVKKRMQGRGPDALLFPPLHRARFLDWLNWGETGQGRTIHDLRHTAVCIWLASGVKPGVVKSWAGHASLSTTDIYIHHLGTEADAEGLALLNQQTGAHRGHTRKGGRRSG